MEEQQERPFSWRDPVIWWREILVILSGIAQLILVLMAVPFGSELASRFRYTGPVTPQDVMLWRERMEYLSYPALLSIGLLLGIAVQSAFQRARNAGRFVWLLPAAAWLFLFLRAVASFGFVEAVSAFLTFDHTDPHFPYVKVLCTYPT